MSSVNTIAQADLSTIERNMLALSKNIDGVTDNIIDISGRITDFDDKVAIIKENVKSLEEEIRDFMFEIRGSSIVSNAQNDMLLKQNELNKKYGHYDKIRKKLSGILNSIDLNCINKDSLLTQREQALLNAPNYYLSYALIALCSWFGNDKITATKALNEALKADESKTSLLMCLVHLKLGRNKTAEKWMKKYLSFQDPNKVSSDIVNVINALASNAYDNSITMELLNSIDSWSNQIKNNDQIRKTQIDRWKDFFSNDVVLTKKESYPYVFDYTSNWSDIDIKLSNSFRYYNAYNDFLDLLDSNTNNNISMDKLIENLINTYDKNELPLRREILKDKLVIENKGIISKAEKEYENSELSLADSNDFYTELTNILFERNDLSSDAKKLAVSYTKDYVITGLEDALPKEKDLGNIEISIDDWIGTTNDGSNEKELVGVFSEHVKKPYTVKLNKNGFINPKTIICASIVLIGLIICFIKIVIGLPIMITGLAVLLAFVLKIFKTRQEIIEEYNKVLEEKLFILYNIIAEIVDIHYLIEDNNEDRETLINYINSFEKNNYITAMNK